MAAAKLPSPLPLSHRERGEIYYVGFGLGKAESKTHTLKKDLLKRFFGERLSRDNATALSVRDVLRRGISLTLVPRHARIIFQIPKLVPLM